MYSLTLELYPTQLSQGGNVRPSFWLVVLYERYRHRGSAVVVVVESAAEVVYTAEPFPASLPFLLQGISDRGTNTLLFS